MKLILLSSAILLSTYQTFARQSDDLLEMSIQDLLNVKVSISSRNETPVWQSASSVTVFRQEDIERLGLVYLSDVFPMVPGFYSMFDSTEGNLSHLVMRGHAQNYANTLLILLNGQRMNDDYTGGINFYSRYFNIQNASRIEIIRGPGSAMYGSNAYTGVINIITDEPQPSKVRVSYGSFQQASVSASITQLLNDWQLATSLHLNEDNGERYRDVFDRFGLQSTTKDPRSSQQVDITLKNFETRFGLHYLSSRRDDFYLFRRLRDGVNQLDLEQWIFSAEHNLITNQSWTLDLSVGHKTSYRDSLGALEPQGEEPFTEADFLFGVTAKNVSNNLALDGKRLLSNKVNLNFGFSAIASKEDYAFLKSNYDIYGDESYLGRVVTFPISTVLDVTRRVYSGYVQTEWDASTATTVTTGLRYDRYNDVDNALSPRFSLVHRTDQQRGFKLIYGEAYRAPSLGDLYDEESGLTVGNRTLKANEIESFELVYFAHNDSSNLVVTYFQNRQKNLVSQFNDGEFSYLANIASNRAKGIEIEWLWLPTEHWQSKFAITHLIKNESRILPNASLTPSEELSPDAYLNYDLQYTYDQWSLNLSGTWRTSVDSLIQDESLFLINSNLSYKITDASSIKFQIKNLTDEQYFTSTYSAVGFLTVMDRALTNYRLAEER